MLSDTALNTFSSGSLVSFGNDDSPRPNSTEKKIIGSMSPLAIDEKTFDGISDRMVATRLCEPLCTCSVVFILRNVHRGQRRHIDAVAGWNTLASVNPTTMATVVITSK